MISAYSGSNWNGLISATLLSIRGKNFLNTAKNKSFIKTGKPKRQKRKTDQEEYQKLKKLKRDQQTGARISQSYDVMRINVSGEMFDIPRFQVKQWPLTLLGSEEVEKYYRPELNTYFFDRNRAVFEHIMGFYRTEHAYVDFPQHLDQTLVQMELDFFRIGWRDLNESFKTLKFEYHGVREKAFAFFNDHNSSVYALCYMFLELAFILISVAHFIVEEDPAFLAYLEEHPALSQFNELNIIAYAGLAFFSVDFVARFCVSLNRVNFFKEVTTWFDIIALLPYFIDLHQHIYCNCDTEDDTADNDLQVVMILKIFRIARCFKIIRRSERLRIIVKILGDCVSELMMMLIVWIIGIVISGSIVYSAENSIALMIHNTTNTYFYSILQSTWWAQVTMSSIGYGDMYPETPVGMFLASVIILGATILTSIPMTFIIRRFSVEYEKVAKRDMPWKVMGSKEQSQNSKELQERLKEKSDSMLAENATYSPVIGYRKSQINQPTILDELAATWASEEQQRQEEARERHGHIHTVLAATTAAVAEHRAQDTSEDSSSPYI